MSVQGLIDSVKGTMPRDVGQWMGEWASEVERVLSEQTGSEVATVQGVGRVTLEAGGKRLRPALTYLCAQAVGGRLDLPRVVRLGACIELVHMATLVHDDVIDDALTRRGRPTAASVYGNTAAILGGDVLLSKAMRLLAIDGDIAVIRTVSEAVVDLAEGEVRELEARGDFDLGEDDHMAILERKTASLISCACRIGAMAGGADQRQVESLARFGLHLGLAFQIADDILDFTGDHAKTGKHVGTDFRDGQATLPLIFLRGKLTPDETAFTRSRFGNGVSDTDVHMVCGWIADRGPLAQARSVASQQVGLALACLESIRPGPFRDLLATVAAFAAERES